MRRKLMQAAGFAAVAGVIAACGGGSSGNENTTETITKQAGDAQTGVVATQLPTQLRVVVQQGGSNKAGETVTWTVSPGGGTVNPTSSVTDGNGVATTTWTLGTIAGAPTVTAGVSASLTATFGATATPGPAASFGIAGGDGQSAGTGQNFGSVLSAKVADQYDNGIDGVIVNWGVQSGSATVQAPTSVTNALGLAAMQVKAGGTIGPVVVRATTAAVAGDADFNLTVTPPPVRVTLGDIYFLSVKNSTQNPAVDTAAVGQPVVWTWSTGTHSVHSTGVGATSFTSSDIYSTPGQTYTITFTQAGTYDYNCGFHGNLMTGRVVVQ